MRMQVILDSSFAHPGSPPICGGKRGEFRDWTSIISKSSRNFTILFSTSPSYFNLSAMVEPIRLQHFINANVAIQLAELSTLWAIIVLRLEVLNNWRWLNWSSVYKPYAPLMQLNKPSVIEGLPGRSLFPSICPEFRPCSHSFPYLFPITYRLPHTRPPPPPSIPQSTQKIKTVQKKHK